MTTAQIIFVVPLNRLCYKKDVTRGQVQLMLLNVHEFSKQKK